MALPSRKYFSLPNAAEILKCTVQDIIHWAAIDAVRIGFPYESDVFQPAHIYDEKDFNKLLDDYLGFAFIGCGYFVKAELYGRCTFTSLELLDGRVILFSPSENEFSEWYKYANNGLEFSQLFIRAEELKELQEIEKDTIEKTFSTRTENNFLRLILSLATSIKGFNPKKPYEAAQLIIDETGIDISKQAISNYITKAYELESKKRD